MVSQRQRLARKRFKAEHPELFPKPDPTPAKDPDKKKKKNSKFKTKRSDSVNEPNKPYKEKGKRRPLRVPGMKPGESCFICKGLDHIAKNCPKKSEWEKNKICLFCRQRGHSLKNCTRKNEGSDMKLCYNCGETGHSLDKCPQPLQDGGTRFANCFICNETGHLSKNCPKNAHGIYPKGGSCKICGGVTHLAKDCPNKHINVSGTGGVQRSEMGGRPSQVTKLTSGDDLEDDFMTVVPFNDDKDKSLKPKNKQGPKVVHFLADFRGSNR